MRLNLKREIVLALVVKLMVLYGLWYAFFSEPELKKMSVGLDPERVAETLIAPRSNHPSPHP